MVFSLTEFNLKKQMWSSCELHVDDRSDSSSTHDMIIGNGPGSSWWIRHDRELQWPEDHLGYSHYSNERQKHSTLSSAEALIEVYLRANEPQTLINQDEYYRAIKILDPEYKQVSASFNGVIKTCDNLHVEEQHQLEILLQKYEHPVPILWNFRRLQHDSNTN
jgi:hypothetical protein